MVSVAQRQAIIMHRLTLVRVEGGMRVFATLRPQLTSPYWRLFPLSDLHLTPTVEALSKQPANFHAWHLLDLVQATHQRWS